MAKYRDPKLQTARPYAGVRRVPRAPKIPFQLRTRPFQIQPFMVHPVLPGETLKNLVLQSRVVSKPLKHSLIGWWCEYYIFYVRLRDIEFHVGTNFVDAMVTSPGTYNPSTIRAAIGSDADAKYYHAAGGTNWLKAATQTIVEYFFRDQGEDYDVSTLDGLPLAQIHGKSWLDSLTIDDDKRTDRRVDLDFDGDGKVEADELETGMQHWQALRDAGLETMDYEDWIRTFGVSVPEVESSFNKYRPELVRYFRQWTYPTNTIDPATGKPSSAVSWINSFRADKDRLFKEPGFLVGLTVQKPKTYIKDTTGGLSSFLETIENWLPALSHSDYEKGFKQFAHGAGPLADKIGTASPGYHGYWVDLRDLLVHGDQFINFAPDTASSALSVLTADGKNRYPAASEIDNLFAGAAPDNIFTTDGVVDLLIHGRQRDRTSGPVL